jgi:putative transposase
MSACRNIYTSLLLVLAGASNKELARQVKYLKVENEILRSKLGKRVAVTPAEKMRLVKFAGKLSAKILNHITSIVSPGTLLRWIREDRKKGKRVVTTNRGRPRTSDSIRKLILKLARENDWGYTRIMGELKKMGIKPPSRNTVKKILMSAKLDPGPPRGEGTWDDFLKRHASSLWQCDFFSRRIVTPTGLRQAFVLAFIHVQSRRVVLSPSTFKPTGEWVEENVKAIVDQAREQGLKVGQVCRDRDSVYTKTFDKALKSKRVEVTKVAFRAPNMNAYAERFVQTIQDECLDHFIVCGTRHFDYLCKEFLEHYQKERPHQGLENCVPAARVRKRKKKMAAPVATMLPRLGEIRCKKRLGGLLKSYSRAA